MFFNDINKVQLLGNITRDPDLKYTPSGTAVLNFSVATSRSYKSGDEWKEQVEFTNVVLWRNAESAASRIRKGTRVLVDGRLQTQSWEKDGVKKYRTEVVADNVLLIARYEDGEEKGQGSEEIEDTRVAAQDAELVDVGIEDGEIQEDDINPDDLPF